MTTDDGWLPRLADGVPIWKLAQDLNQAALLDGSLIVPETEGNPSSPRVVRWHVRNLLSLDDARAQHPEALLRSISSFEAATKRLEAALSDTASAYHAFRKAFSLPALSNEHYFFDARDEKLYVIHWGAEPRSHAARGETVHGFGSLDQVFAPRPEAHSPNEGGASDPSNGASPMEAPTSGTQRLRWLWIAAVLAAAGVALYLLRPRTASLPPPPSHPLASVAAPSTLPSSVVTAVKAPVGRETLVPLEKPLLFEYGSARVDAQGETNIRSAAAYIVAHPEIVRVRIEGHADATGEDDKNFVLSTARALAVRRALVSAGVDAERLSIDAHGQSQPVVPDAGALLLNRRVELWALRHETGGGKTP